MALSTEQVLLLENLMYATPGEGSFPAMESYEGQTVGEWINSIDVNTFQSNDSFMGTDEWTQIIQAVKSDPSLTEMKIVTTHSDNAAGGGGGKSAVFVNESTNDAVVAFKGTESSQEWYDNFTGGNVTDTTQQQNALQWYQDTYKEYNLSGYEITITGHSKGGNKAKYITLMDETIDHCVSFDGQGFSDKFMEKYASEIAARQHKIENHNVDYDFVNILLNDVGETTYYEGYNIGEGGFLENHCPNGFMQFHEDGSFSLTVNTNGQAPEMQALDEFLNSYLRSMPDAQRSETLQMVNDILGAVYSIDENMQGSDIINLFLDIAADPRYTDDLAYLVAYFVKYEQEHPEMAEMIKNVLGEFGMEDFVKFVDMADGIINGEWEFLGKKYSFSDIAGIVGGLSGFLSENCPDWILKLIRDYLKDNYGIQLSNDQVRNLLKLVGTFSSDLGTVNVHGNGQDIQIPSTVTGASNNTFYIIPEGLKSSSANTKQNAVELTRLAAEIKSISTLGGMSIAYAIIVKRSLKSNAQEVERHAASFRRMADTLNEIAGSYRATETKLVG